MEPRPAKIPPQTAKQAKAAFKKYGPRLSVRELREIERGEELQRRADRIKEQERRKKAAQKKRAEKEQKDREARATLGMGLATQLAGYSLTQKKMKAGMENFLGLVRQGPGKAVNSRDEARQQPFQMATEREEKEPCDTDMDVNTPLQAQTDTRNEDPWSQDGLDDEILIEAQEQASSEPWDDGMDDTTLIEIIEGQVKQKNEPVQGSLPKSLMPSYSIPPREDPTFTRLHGPVDKAIEKLLESLPEPLVEILSQDTSRDSRRWDPAHSLLHRLKPHDLPLHRLRLKVGCAVELLQDLDSDSRALKNSHLRVVEISGPILECVGLDGQLEGTMIFLPKMGFSGRYRNDDQFSFMRTQFPVRVVSDLWILEEQLSPATRDCKRSCEATGSPRIEKRAKFTRPFEGPTIPASKKPTPLILPKPPQTTAPAVPDFWDNFLASGTQIARELSSDSPPAIRKTPAKQAPVALSSEDFDLSEEDLEELGHLPTQGSYEPHQTTVAKGASIPPLVPATGQHLPKQQSISTSTSRFAKPHPPTKLAGNISMMPPASRKPSLPSLPTAALSKPTPSLPRLAQPIKPAQAAKPISVPSLEEFGISTQDIASLIEDIEDTEGESDLSSPPTLNFRIL